MEEEVGVEPPMKKTRVEGQFEPLNPKSKEVAPSDGVVTHAVPPSLPHTNLPVKVNLLAETEREGVAGPWEGTKQVEKYIPSPPKDFPLNLEELR